jgi:G3E family GTPase
MAHPIAANLITGFLGSGKTTLMKYVLTHGLAKERVAVIMNEVAELGIDGKVLQGLNVDRMVELSNGCICCSGVLQLGLAVQEIMETVKPTVLLVESSGVAEPVSVVAELRGIGVRTDAVITVVDAENIDRYRKESDVVEEQIREV